MYTTTDLYFVEFLLDTKEWRTLKIKLEILNNIWVNDIYIYFSWKHKCVDHGEYYTKDTYKDPFNVCKKFTMLKMSFNDIVQDPNSGFKYFHLFSPNFTVKKGHPETAELNNFT